MLNLSVKPHVPPWERSRVVSYLLTPLGWLYGLVMEVRNRLYDLGVFKIHRLPVPVISIGNLTVGGTGKTPLTIEIVRGLLRKNPLLKIGVISRGYRRKKRDNWIVSDGENILTGVEESGDEPQLIARHLGGVRVFVGSDRVVVGRRAIARYPIDMLILDDAFQHRRIHRDVDILVIDGEKGLGGGRVLPSGPLREFASNINRASCLVISHFNNKLPQDVRRYCPSEMPLFKTRLSVSGIMEGISGKEISPEEMKGEKVWGVCGIAHPGSFMKTIRELSVEIAGFTAFPDHYFYSRHDLDRVASQEKAGATIITTEKDWVKWEGRHSFKKIYVVSVKTEFVNGEDIYDFIEKFVYNKGKDTQGGLN